VSEHGLDRQAVDWLDDQDMDGFRPREEFLATARSHFHLGGTVADMVARYDEVYPRYYLREDTSIEALRRLRSAGWKVGVVTNGRPSQLLKLKMTEIDGEIDAAVSRPSLVRASRTRPYSRRPPGVVVWNLRDGWSATAPRLTLPADNMSASGPSDYTVVEYGTDVICIPTALPRP
jgi:hypothetical protein